ncbi:hypothetical protein C3B78_03870 [Arthrobacter sp. PGP41]|uniref:hypothetical protein n=1 Tax=unclassified Arthrobacter TaxID=235627 RepID=UPI000CDBA900|nr:MULTISPECIES: hypothetical protein [unclassified Arthrobacter]AUZ33688.1 hypothetical protein C3B78_03870 [Arthrobacter sp. PGP41]MDT0195417.1 hypothetical protein [Arthrobacter sp. AB6]
MTLPAKAFQRWLQGIAPDASTADVCRVSGIKRTTLAQQLVRGKVAVGTVVSISRAYGVNPVAALASFEAYRDLAGPLRPPTPAELVSQISTADLLRALLARPAMEAAVPAKETLPLSAVPHSTSVKNWVDAIDDGEVRHRVSAATGVAPQNYSAQLTANRLSPELAIATSLAAGVGPTGGLVATGLITEEEAGWPAGARQGALDSLSDGDLTALAGDRLQALGKVLRRQEQDQAQTEKIWENLG